jgi:hypothetical protein
VFVRYGAGAAHERLERMDTRWGERIQVDFPVRMTAHRFAVRKGRLTDLSVSGASIESNFEPRLQSRIEIAMVSPLRPKYKSPVVVGYVTRRHKEGIGVEWCEFAPQVVSELLRNIVTRPHLRVRRLRASASVTRSRLSAPLLRHA